MNYLNSIINFIFIFSIYLTSIDSSNCEYDNTRSDILIIDINKNIDCTGEVCNDVDKNIILSDNYYLKISSAGTYNIQGKFNGQILIEASEEDFVHLVFNNVTIENKNGPALLIARAEEVILTLNGNNTLNESETNSIGATLYSISNLIIDGKGKLDIKNKNKDAIFCAKQLKLISGILSIESMVHLEQNMQNECSTTIIAKDSICINDNFKFEFNKEDTISTTTSKTFSTPVGDNGNTHPTSPPKSIPPSITTANTSRPTTCSSAIIRQGYACCPSNCVIVYVDESGTWGIINNRWCGCKGGGDNDYTCQVSIIKQGYNCCSKDNCKIILTDETGRWGVENSQWCGIYLDCM